jgi:hypothetical protein
MMLLLPDYLQMTPSHALNVQLGFLKSTGVIKCGVHSAIPRSVGEQESYRTMSIILIIMNGYDEQTVVMRLVTQAMYRAVEKCIIT